MPRGQRGAPVAGGMYEDGDHEDRVTAIAGELIGADDPEPRDREDPDRDLEEGADGDQCQGEERSEQG